MAKRTTADDTDPGKHWYNGAPDTLHQTVTRLEHALTPVRWLDATAIRTYYSEPATDWPAGVTPGGEVSAYVRALRAKMRFNLLKSCIDALASQIVQVPAVDVATVGGGAAQQRSAEALGLFIDGVFAANDLERTLWSCFIDCCNTRVAAVRVDVDRDDSIRIERLPPYTIVWHPYEGLNPRNLYLRTPVAKAALIERYPEQAKAIEAAPRYKPDELWVGVDGVYGYEMPSEMVLFEEGYRRCSPGNGGKDGDGRYVCAIGNAVLDDSVYPHEFHTIVPLRFSPSFTSFAGVPASDVLLAYQDALDRHASNIDEAMQRGSVLRVLIPRGSEIDPDSLTNMQGSIVEYNPGMPPEFVPGVALSPDYYQREQLIIDRAHQFLGLSPNVASGTRAPGVTSAKGQREVKQLADQRLILHMQNVDGFIERIAKTVIAVADYHFKGRPGAEMRAPGGRWLRRVRWSEIGYKAENFEVHVDTVNALSRHPAARIEEILELAQAGIIDQRYALKQTGIKDLQSIRDQVFAPEELADKQIERALAGDYLAPEVYQGATGLQYLIDRGGERYVHEMLQDKPSENLRDLRKLIEQAKDLLKQAQPPPPPAANGPPPGPPANVDANGQTPPPPGPTPVQA